MPKGWDTQQQAEEDQDQNRTGDIKVLQRLPSGQLIPGGEETGGKNTCTNGHTHPQHTPPSVSGQDQAANGGADDHRRAGKEHIQGKSLCDLVLRKFGGNIGKDHRPHCGGADAHNKPGDQHKGQGGCQGRQHIAQGEYPNAQKKRFSAPDHISDFAENGRTGCRRHGLGQGGPGGVLIGDAHVLHKSRT